jgi:hypothetical protein
MPELAELRRHALRAWGRRAAHRSGPGADWGLRAGAGLSRQAREDLADVLRLTNRDPIALVWDDVLDAIDAHATQAWLDRCDDSQGRDAAAFRAWTRSAARRLEKLRDWLAAGPLRGPVAARECQRLSRHLEDFQDWLDTHGRRAERGRPADWRRSELTEHVGNILWIAGRRPTAAAGSEYARALQIVLTDAGWPLGPDANLLRDVRAAVMYHTEWKQPATIDQLEDIITRSPDDVGADA